MLSRFRGCLSSFLFPFLVGQVLHVVMQKLIFFVDSLFVPGLFAIQDPQKVFQLREREGFPKDFSGIVFLKDENVVLAGVWIDRIDQMSCNKKICLLMCYTRQA